MSELDLILEKLASIEGRLTALEGTGPVIDPWDVSPSPLDFVDWVAQWESLGHGYASAAIPGLPAFLGAVCDEADALSQALENPWADVFGAVAMLSCHYKLEVEPSYMNDVPFGQFIGVVYNYLIAEKNEDGDSGGVTFWELLEAIAYGIDNVLRHGPLVTDYRSEHRISGLKPGLPVDQVLSPLALLFRRIAVFNGERGGMGEDGHTVIVPSDPPPGGWPWSMPE